MLAQSAFRTESDAAGKLLFWRLRDFRMLSRLGGGVDGVCPVSGRIPCLVDGNQLATMQVREIPSACCWRFPVTGVGEPNAS